MKRLICFIVLLGICCLLCACDPGQYLIDREALSNVISIELIEYENTNQKHFTTWVPDQFDKLVPFDPTNATIIETLPADKVSSFLDAFAKTDILHTYYAYNSPKDICIRLNYESGDFLIIWANYAENRYAGYIGEYSADGTVSSFWGSFSSLSYYTDLVNHFFAFELQ